MTLRDTRTLEHRLGDWARARLPFALAAAIYLGFFAHHFLPDIRLAPIVANVALHSRTRIWFRIHDRHWWMPLPVAALPSAVALWVAENVGTATGTWIYSGQIRGEMVSFAKLVSWYLRLYVAFVTVTLVTRRALHDRALDPGPSGEILAIS